MAPSSIQKYATKVNGKGNKDIFLFTLSTCVWCSRAKEFLQKLGLKYYYINVDETDGKQRDEIVAELDKFNSSHSFPTIIIDNKTILGYDENELRKLAR